MLMTNKFPSPQLVLDKIVFIRERNGIVNHDDFIGATTPRNITRFKINSNNPQKQRPTSS